MDKGVTITTTFEPQYAQEPPPGYAPPGTMYTGPPPIMVQPGMPVPGPAPNMCVAINQLGGPLEYLAAVDQLIIRQEIHLADVMMNIQSNTKYDIQNNQGQLVYRAEEENDCCSRNCGGAARAFNIVIRDSLGCDVINVSRPCRCCGCCFPCCCLQELTVESPPGNVIGVIRENWNIFNPSFTVHDDRDDPLFKISGPCCPGGLCYAGQDVKFEIIDVVSSSHVGKISKQWAGAIQEMFTRANNFNVQFPMELSVNHKAILLSTAFLLNFMYFQKTPEQHRDHHHTSSS